MLFAFLKENAFFIISCCPEKSIPCLNLPTDPITPDNLTWGTIIFFLKMKTCEFRLTLFLISALKLNLNVNYATLG